MGVFMGKNKFILFDRDGVINIEKSYLYKIEEIRLQIPYYNKSGRYCKRILYRRRLFEIGKIHYGRFKK